ncbi:Uncharacterised protein [Sebaldella termitidis]|uniref:Uncharacterized protein n=1 Tax=Sebaldella termitidis (strain ATCC 33386 / NCTC 11300) TaxID=526218 RepID=D1AHL6_SEBTE|nr:hypothetical protein [Sebaldella termitidis]ACZ08250.1 hypothetical protein Sterm_1387 [Sebaldella termitidis ATCC 33386]SUI23558.1 Uncharacterised protein [Sebaldella termitidis]
MKKVTLIIGLLAFIVLAVGSVDSDTETTDSTVTESIATDEIKTVFKELGISDNFRIEPDPSLDNLIEDNTKGYRIKADYIGNAILYLKEDGTISSIRYADKYMFKNGKVVDKITNYIVTEEEANKIRNMTIKAMKDILVSPNSAKFKNLDEWRFEKKKNIITSQSEVTSKNAFGVEVRNEFQIKYDIKNGIVKSFILDGTEYID